MKVTKIQPQVARKDRYSVYIDGTYRFSLHEYQLAGSGLRLGKELTPEDVENFANESQFGKAYERALNYIMIRPRSEKEIHDYLVRTFLYPKPKSYVDKNGVRRVKKIQVDTALVTNMITRVMTRLHEKGYIDDLAFARAWVDSRQQLKKSSVRKVTQELRAKGVKDNIIVTVMQNSEVDDRANLRALIAKKQRLSRYQDTVKLTQYLLRQGFSYDDIKEELQ
jgi:regulatory protein